MASPDRRRGTRSELVDRSTVQASRALDLMARQADTQDPFASTRNLRALGYDLATVMVVRYCPR
jgi:hypothetical protein